MNIIETHITNIDHLIPQKYPFVMVDDLCSFSKSKITSSFVIKEDNIFFYKDVLLEPGLIENMAQTIALHTGYEYFLKNQDAPTGYIGSIKNIEIMELPKLNEKITTKAEILHEFMGVTLVEIQVFGEAGTCIASGQMKTVIATS